MAEKSVLKDRVTGEVLLPITSADCVIYPIVAVKGSTLAPEAGKYYRFDEAVNNLTINLPEVPRDKVCSLIVYFTTGDTPAIHIEGANLDTVEFFEGFRLDMRTTYELNLMFNGNKWIVGYGAIY